MKPADPMLLQRVADGDRSAFSTFYDRYAGRILGLLVKLLRERAAAEDVLQDTFLQVWRQAARYDPEKASAPVWLMMIARSRASDHRRRRRRPDSEVPEHVEGVLESPDGGAQRSEMQHRARIALATLPAEQRSAIELAFFSGMTHVEIAEHQSQPLGTVKTRIRLGMQRLRASLGAENRTRTS